MRAVYPYSSDRAALQARRLLRTASRVLGTVDPAPSVSGLLDDALPLPPGDPRYAGTRAFQPRFSELSGGSLTFGVEVPERGPAGGGGVAAASQEVRGLVAANLGRPALAWFDRHTDGAADSVSALDVARVVSAFDRDGFREASVTYMWGPWFTGAMPEPAARVAGTVVSGIPGAEPAFTSIRAGRTYGSQAMTFRLAQELPLEALGPVMEQLGLGRSHASLTTAVAFVLGARYSLPGDSAMLTLRPLRRGLELRLDIDLEAIPDLPEPLADLIALHLAERPRSLRALEQWVAAFSPEDAAGPGSLSVLSVTVRPDMGARLTLHIRPHLVSTPGIPSATYGAAPMPTTPAVGAVSVPAQAPTPVPVPGPLMAQAGWR